MKLRLLTTLLAAALLLSALSCSKKDDSSPSFNSSYKLDGEVKKCQATFSAYTNTFYGGQTMNVVEVRLTTVPQPASGEETLELVFFKDGIQPPTAYQLLRSSTLWVNHHGYQHKFINDTTATFTPTSNGFSGTFSAKYRDAPSPYSILTEGTFTDARP